MDSQILSLYAKGMTTREIVATFKEMYDADVSPTLISKVTDAVKEQVSEWQNRPLDALYPIVYLDCIVVKVRHGGSVINKRCSSRWASIPTVRKSCWVCGWQKMKVQSSGWVY